MPRAASDLRSAPVLPDRYAIVRHIANGGMASVWAAEDCVLGRTVAIKVLAAHLAGDPENALRFRREARAAARVSSHPNVVTIYDVGDVEGRSFIVMEYLRGGSVADAVRTAGPRGVSRREAVAWLRDAAAALDAGHALGIVHRDIKPANLLLDDRRRALVADFGIARLATEATMTTSGQLLGTAAYLSPEQALGQPATAASDIYSLSVVAYELLTGTRPFTAEHFAAQARQHVEAAPPPASERDPALPPDVDPVLARGLAKDPDERWLTATAFVEALEGTVGRPPAPAADPVTDPTRVLAPTGARRPPEPPAAPEPHAPAAAGRAPAARAPAVLTSPSSTGARALAALAAVALLGALLAVLLTQGADEKPAGGAGRSSAQRSGPAPSPPARSGSTSATTPAAARTSPSAAIPAPASSPDGASAATLEARGHSLLQSDPAAAIPVLRRALAATGQSVEACRQPSGATCQTFAFALFDLGHALRLAGQPAQAVPVLEQRARIDNQPGIVAAELALARQQAGAGSGG